MRIHHFVLSPVLVLLCCAPASGQSLADVAAAEAARRKTVTASSKLYTNESLAPAAQQADPVAASSATPKSDAAKPDTAKPDPAAEVKTEKYWKGRITAVQQGIARNKVVAEAMQSRMNALNAQALNTDDPGQRAIVQANLTKAAGEMQQLTQESEKHHKELTAIQEEARRANVPPGWLR